MTDTLSMVDSRKRVDQIEFGIIERESIALFQRGIKGAGIKAGDTPTWMIRTYRDDRFVIGYPKWGQISRQGGGKIDIRVKPKDFTNCINQLRAISCALYNCFAKSAVSRTASIAARVCSSVLKGPMLNRTAPRISVVSS